MDDPETKKTEIHASGKVQANLWLTVLAAAEIHARVHCVDEEWRLEVLPEEYEKACSEIVEYERINKNWPPPVEVYSQTVKLPAAPGGIFVLMLFFADILYGVLGKERNLFERFIMDRVALFSEGEYYRCVTGIFLHSDAPHLFGNALSAYFFINTLAVFTGNGCALMLMLLCGTFANAFSTWLNVGQYRALGASNAVFAALGASVVFYFVEQKKYITKSGTLQHPYWKPLVAGLGVLAFFGTSAGSDITGHLSGFIFGGIAALALCPFPIPRKGLLQYLFWGIFFAIIATAFLQG